MSSDRRMHTLALEYAEATRRSAEGRVYLVQPRDGTLRYETFRYRPNHHFQRAYDRLTDHWEIEPDGGYDTLHAGTQVTTVYYWLNPATGAALYHTGIDAEESIPFFPDEETAQDYLAKRAAGGDDDQYDGLSLYKARSRKVGDAVDVLTDQAGFEEFIPDGGRPKDNLDTEQVWFWYNPSLDSIVQEEIEPYDVRGVFATEDDASRFLDWYAEQYGVVDTSHLELYRADLSLEGFGRKHMGAAERSEEPPEQVDFAAFKAAATGATAKEGDSDRR